MSKRFWGSLIAAYLCVLIVSAPAGLLSPIIEFSSKGRMGLANTDGTIWNGSANPVLHQRSGGLITLTTVHWDIATLALFSGKLHAKLRWNDAGQTVPMEVVVSTAQIELRHTYIPLSAILLDEISDFLKPAALHGQIIVKSEALFVTRQGVQGTATADWLNASSLLSDISPLGNYHFTFYNAASGSNIDLSTTSGMLILAGQGRFSATDGLDFHGTAQAAKGKEDALRELLNQLGPEERPGINTFTLVPSRVH